ncbi:hypothetical protein GCM10008983_17170 [Lentibacillus halophilus]|uniref:Lipoprotein n=1 Tax=Lentibacillus halophilus TaxID=295065 RepID=A0ABP3J3U6_9BACI
MKKIFFLIILTVGVLLGACTNDDTHSDPGQDPHSPLQYGTIGSLDSEKGVVIAIGTKGSEKIKIDDVSVNNDKQPKTVKMQVSDPRKGFIITDTFDKKIKSKYGVKNVKEVTLQPHTSPQKQLERSNKDHSNENIVSYGLSVVHDKPIHKVMIDYRYSEESFEKTIQIKEMPIREK